MKKTLLKSALLALAGIGLLAANASAAIITNGGFETGDFTGWTANLNDSTASAVVTTSSNAFDGTTYTATEGVYFAELTASSDIVQSNFSWDAGDVISFDWAFLAMDYMPFNDYAFFSTYDSATNAVNSVTLSSVFATGDYNDTGWNSYSYQYLTDGAGYIQFGSQDYGDTILSSVLLVDNVAVPEPATMLLFGTCLAGLAGVARRKSKKA